MVNLIKLTKIDLLNILITILPLSLIIGNLAININIILICAIGFYNYGLDIFFVKKKVIIYLLYSFFIYLIFITVYNYLPLVDQDSIYKEHIFKSFLYLRFLILFLVINKIIEKNILNLKPFILFSAFLSLIISIDILIEVKTGYNITQNPLTLEKPASFFGSEKIAGGYLQKFALFFLILGFVHFYFNKHKKIFFLIASAFFFIIILLTNNRMPLVIYFFSIVFYLFFIYQKNLKKKVLALIFFAITFLIIINQNESLKLNYNRFSGNIKQMLRAGPELFLNNNPTENLNRSNLYLLVFNGTIQLIKKNPFVGYGIKSYRINCKYEKKKNISIAMCQTHPHNYLLEIILDSGLIGFFLIYTFFILIMLNFYNYYKLKKNHNDLIISLPFVLILFFEFFPLRSSGSFFSTTNAVTIFTFLAIVLNIEKINFKALQK